jgi:hypothetical protein
MAFDTYGIQAFVVGVHALPHRFTEPAADGQVIVFTGPYTWLKYPDEESFLVDYEWV